MAEVTFATRSEVASPTANPGVGQAMGIFPFPQLVFCPLAFIIGDF